jgi:hypothetical protein
MKATFWKRLLVAGAAVGLLTAAYERIDPPVLMADAAKAYLAALKPDLRQRATIPFEGDERSNWHFIPLDNRKGVALREMTPEQKHLADALLSAGLSQQGFIKAHTIMSLEQVLKDLEIDNANRLERDPEKYFLSIFGTPDEKGTWGYRFEGHHVSLNFTILNGKVVASTPNFWGANPAKVPGGPRAGLRALKRQEDLAFKLVQSLNADQKTTAVVDKTAYKDILTGDARKAALSGQPNGLPYSKMNAQQKEMVADLINEYAADFPPAIAEMRIDQFKKTQNSLFLAWAGGTQPGDQYYYRIQTSAFLIEYDKTQDKGNHIHSVWRDFNGDFGQDVLAQHYQSAHK